MVKDDDGDFPDVPNLAPAPAPARSNRFAPKGSKHKHKPKPKPPPSSSASSSLSAPKKEELDIKPYIKPEELDIKPVIKTEEVDIKPLIKPEHEIGAVAMDVELNFSEERLDVADDFMETEAAEVEVEHGDGDEIIREMDVYFAPYVDPETRLYLFQYPLRPLWRPYELDERCEVRVKATSAEVEVDLPIDVDSMNYDVGADPRLQMKKQTLALSWKPPQNNGYTVGVLKENKIHLNPIHAVVQLRPSMRHLGPTESKKKTGAAEDVVKLEKHQEAKPPRVSKNQAPNPKSLQKAPEQTKDSGEDWVPLKYHSMTSDIAAGYLEKMITQEGSQICFSMSSGDYLNSLCPGTSVDRSSSKDPPIRSLLAKPLKERFRTWLLEGPPLHRFDTLKHLAPDESVEEVVAILQELAVLVQGLWVPKTSLVSGTEGIAVIARDLVLLLFSKDVIIKDDQIPSKTQLKKAMLDVLRGLATQRLTFKDWKLKQLPDLNFIKLNPTVVKKQRIEWENVEKKIGSILSGGKNGTKTSNSRAPTNLVALNSSDKLAEGTSSGSTPRNVMSSGSTPRNVTSSGSTPRNVMSEIVRVAIKKALQELFKSTKTCSFQQINQWLREKPVSASAHSKGFTKEDVVQANSIDAFPDELQTIISEVAVNIHGICVPKSSPDHPEHDDFRKVVIDLFIAEGPNARLKKAQITEAAIKNLQNMNDAAYKKVLPELCVYQGSAWVLKR